MSCFTDNGCNVVAIPGPTTAPSLSVDLASGTLPAGKCYVKITYTGVARIGGESNPLPEDRRTVCWNRGTHFVSGWEHYKGTAAVREQYCEYAHKNGRSCAGYEAG